MQVEEGRGVRMRVTWWQDKVRICSRYEKWIRIWLRSGSRLVLMWAKLLG